MKTCVFSLKLLKFYVKNTLFSALLSIKVLKFVNFTFFFTFLQKNKFQNFAFFFMRPTKYFLTKNVHKFLKIYKFFEI